MGKDWAKGLTASTDVRVARNALAHLGRNYVRRIPPEVARWRHYYGPVSWSQKIAYAVGLIATDGCLVTGRKVIQFGSQDLELVELLLRCLDRRARIRLTPTRLGNPYYRTQFSWAHLYSWLLGVGLTPRKSLTLGALDVPDEFLLSLVRGLLDGDGSIINETARADTADNPDYRWEYLQTKFISASRPHIEWLRSRLLALLEIDGYVQTTPTARGGLMSELRYGKRASVVLLPAIYPKFWVPCLSRKRAIWESYRRRHLS